MRRKKEETLTQMVSKYLTLDVQCTYKMATKSDHKDNDIELEPTNGSLRKRGNSDGED